MYNLIHEKRSKTYMYRFSIRKKVIKKCKYSKIASNMFPKVNGCGHTRHVQVSHCILSRKKKTSLPRLIDIYTSLDMSVRGEQTRLSAGCGQIQLASVRTFRKASPPPRHWI